MGIRTMTKRSLDSLPSPTNLLTQTLSGDTTNSTSKHFTRISRPVMAHYAVVYPDPSPDPVLLSAATPSANAIDLDPASFTTPQFLSVFSGETILPGTQPYAINYAGHQFSLFAGQLGDGRAISLFETENSQGERWDVQIKGAGRTPFSRFGDGYAVLRSSIREYLGAEHMHALGIPTTRSLALLGSSRQVYRDDTTSRQPERGAIVVRLAPSWIRFGNFELFYSRNDMNGVRQLADYCLDHVFGGGGNKLDSHYSCLKDLADDHKMPATAADKGKDKDKSSLNAPVDGNKYAQLFIKIAKRTAVMVAGWQANGFNHGVMNTDNMSVLGLTLDYGPFQILDYYDPSYVCNHSDDAGQYAFKRQPTVCIYNLFKLGVPLFELIGAKDKVDTLIYANKDKDANEEEDTERQQTPTDESTRQEYREIGKEYVTKILSEDFTDWFMEALDTKMRAKLGLTRQDETIMHDVIIPLLDWATEYEVDYHRFFRSLSNYTITADGEDGDADVALDIENSGSSGGTKLDIVTKDLERLVECKETLKPWLAIYRHAILLEEEESTGHHHLQQQQQTPATTDARRLRMDANNPEVIDAFENLPEAEAIKILNDCLYACSHPYQDHYDQEIVERWISTPVPEWSEGLKCSCSS
ncbi:hypothetical protein BCR42DRAFT_404860 [Absidia repens]|uniref:Selenoprotein O n=1 Tax=Absidia repens TaxID=90262 RepID=A0A1X2IWP5_9FUNG|nr:hypothetical protein BCR42DRAFT_404860 [Absidia repens]